MYHELFFNLAKTLETGRELNVVVGGRLSDGGDDRDPVTLGTDAVCG